ncbi:hypothetical protein UVI_02036000 [Ustilaginoidea virens]|uniref:Uncharacterized protein n=1 Tax=Ustilaginoidea virens TaxID=1159556 RepID=A0A1B5KT18_USTVR|nr:hypothetical protein UVI_02036000 [Ustilaginoidea virens]
MDDFIAPKVIDHTTRLLQDRLEAAKSRISGLERDLRGVKAEIAAFKTRVGNEPGAVERPLVVFQQKSRQ